LPTRTGRKGAFRYLDGRGRKIDDPQTIARIERLAIPPAWKDVWIASRAGSKLQATGYDRAGRKQYLYHSDFRAAQEQEKFERLIRFGERLPELRAATAEDLGNVELDRDRVSAIAVALIDLGWFRAGSDRHTERSGTYGITTLRKRHVSVRGRRIRFEFLGKGRARIKTTLVDDELAAAIHELLALPGGRLFRYLSGDGLCNLTNRVLNEYLKRHLGEEFTAKDFRTWGGTLLAAIAFAELGLDRNGAVTTVMRRVAAQLGNTPAVCRASYVAPAVVDQYLQGRTIADFPPKEPVLDPPEESLLALLRFAADSG
jgi:DNA topoisomerase I